MRINPREEPGEATESRSRRDDQSGRLERDEPNRRIRKTPTALLARPNTLQIKIHLKNKGY